jgi:hypothetical protein
VHRFDGLVAVARREVHGALQDFLRFDCQTVDVHILFSFYFRVLSVFSGKQQNGCQRTVCEKMTQNTGQK